MEFQHSISKVETRRYCIKWEIEQFPFVAKCSDLISSQSFHFETGLGEINDQFKWKMFLSEEGQYIVPNIKLVSQSTENDVNFYAQFKFLKGSEAADPTGVDLHDRPGILYRSAFEMGLRGGKFIDLDSFDSYKDCLDKNGTLLITFIIQYYGAGENVKSNKNLLSLPKALAKFNSKSQPKAFKDIGAALQKSKIPFTDVTIISGDKKEMKAKWGVLAARSQVFAKMYKSDLTERKTGIIKLENMTGQTLDVFHHFIFTGKLLPGWKNDDVILELVNAAVMYQLTNLLKFLDQNLGLVCNERTVIKLLGLAQKLEMEKAPRDLLDWIMMNGVNSPEEFMQILEPAVSVVDKDI